MTDTAHDDEYDDNMVTVLELIYGDGFIAPGGPEEIRHLVGNTDLKGKHVLDIGCGVGGVDVMLARDHGCSIIGIDVEAPLIERGKKRVAGAGLEDSIYLRLVEPGPLPLDDVSVDVVFSKDVWIHIPDKPALLADVYRVLKPGGLLLAADWCCGPDPYSPEMERFFELEGLTYHMATLNSYEEGLKANGFVDIETFDISDRFRVLSQNQYYQIIGPMKETMESLVGEKETARIKENWEQLLIVIDGGELRPGHMRARKPG